jgi:bifunctional UDP-N-acetylglucosamine pyrophosphorylase/glucosamine-1-phosphate N-acetyltransferase
MDISVVILAAGKGSRMNSELPKVLHQIANNSLLFHVLRVVRQLKLTDITVVASQELSDNHEFKVLQHDLAFKVCLQKERLGTAHALSAALEVAPNKPVLVLNGDTPLLKAKTLQAMIDKFVSSKASIVNLAFKTARPYGYGRLVTDGDKVEKIVEERDASADEKQIKICNAGAYLIASEHITKLLSKIDNNNLAKEYYLTDIIKHASNEGLQAVFTLGSGHEAMGINDKVQLAAAENSMQKRLRSRALKRGVTLIDPNSVFLTHGIKFGKDVVIEPFVVIRRDVEIGNNVRIKSFTHLEGAKIGNTCDIGPFSRIRPKTVINDESKIGNFIEIKSSTLGQGVKASHLSYIGDAVIGNNCNIGAGTIFCNYDGFRKNHTFIGKNTFVGSNTALVAPLHIGEGAIIGAGSVITEDVDTDDLAIARTRQVNYPKRAVELRKTKEGE